MKMATTPRPIIKLHLVQGECVLVVVHDSRSEKVARLHSGWAEERLRTSMTDAPGRREIEIGDDMEIAYPFAILLMDVYAERCVCLGR